MAGGASHAKAIKHTNVRTQAGRQANTHPLYHLRALTFPNYHRSVKDALRGTDVVGSHVRITVRRGDASEETVTLRRSPMSYVYLIQVQQGLHFRPSSVPSLFSNLSGCTAMPLFHVHDEFDGERCFLKQ